MRTSIDVADLIEFSKAGHPGVILCGPVREGMSSSVVPPNLQNLFDADLAKHHVVIGKSQDGMRIFADIPSGRKSKQSVSCLLNSLIRRI
ncbi:hypothetical protein LPN04_30975 [Rugamonas sp. A1-17]|nr:hypothetical protein [Rugamonas sp. A1-17]